MSSKGTQVRVSGRTQRAIAVIVARMQEKIARNVTVDEALWEMVVKTYPDVAVRFQDDEDDENGNGDNNGGK